MRTTVSLPDDVYVLVRSLAIRKGISLGNAVAELVRESRRATGNNCTNSFPCFVVPDDAEPITLEQTLAAEDGPEGRP